MSQEQVLKTLESLGFDEIDAQIYVYLAKKGTEKACNIIKALKLTKQQFYPSVKRLQSKGIVNSTIERPARFSVISFEKFIDLFIEAKIEEARSLRRSKAEILQNWHNLRLEDDASAKFTVIEGRSFIYSKIYQMIQETKDSLIAVTTVPAMAQANQRDVFEPAYNSPFKNKIRLRFLTELSEKNLHLMKELQKEFLSANLNVEIRNPDLGLTLFPHMIIRDAEEVLFFIRPRIETSIIEKNDTCLWTDCKTLVKAFYVIFEDIWRNSTGVAEKMVELETGEPAPKRLVMGDIEVAKRKYEKISQSAKEEVLVVASPKGLADFSQNLEGIHEWVERGVVVKIMAPITRENLEIARHLSRLCLVSHIPPNYTPTTIIDGKHLFQFKSLSESQYLNSSSKFDSLLYSSHPDYVKKNKCMMEEIWKNSSKPFLQNFEPPLDTGVLGHCAYFPGVIRSPGPHGKAHPLPPNTKDKKSYSTVRIINEDPTGKLVEQDILNEIIKTHKSPSKTKPGVCKVYASQAIALIHPPDFFGLPPLLIRAHRIEKTSTFGAEDIIMINLLRETANGPAYVPVAVFSDSLKARTIWEKHFEASPAGHNFQLAKNNELQIWVHGNTLFAGWTVPISLGVSEYVLPPACMLIEGYGDVRTEAFSVVQVSGEKFTARQNGFDAFVTFMHPSSKYSGPGTDGYLVRDYIMDVSPKFIENFHPKQETRLIKRN